MVLYCPSSLVHSPERVIRRFSVPLFLALDPATLGSVSGYLSLDSDGAVVQTYFNPGGYEGAFAVQALLLGARPRFAGTSTHAFL